MLTSKLLIHSQHHFIGTDAATRIRNIHNMQCVTYLQPDYVILEQQL